MAIEVLHIRRGDRVEGGDVLAFDAFDGVHPGQIQIIEDARQHAKTLGAPLAALSLEPHPNRLLHPHVAPFALVTRDQEIRALNQLQVDRLYVLTFDSAMARMSHDDFAREVLRDTLKTRHVSASIGVAYGHNRLGGSDTLRREGQAYGFGVSYTEPYTDAQGQVYSSATVRKLLGDGRMRDVASLFGRPFAVEGAVQHGAKLGRTIGFPTANISLGDYIRPAAGIYASVSLLADGRRLPSLSYIGRRPTVDDGDARLEVFLFDFDGDLYGQPLETALIEFLRPDERFDSLEAMQAQMENDRVQGRAIAFAALSTVVFAR